MPQIEARQQMTTRDTRLPGEETSDVSTAHAATDKLLGLAAEYQAVLAHGGHESAEDFAFNPRFVVFAF